MTTETTTTTPTYTCSELTFESFDGQSIFYRRWLPNSDAKPKGAILLFHRGHEHGGRMAHLVKELKLPDYAFYAWDARGHGLTPGNRGDAPSFAALVRDLDCFVRHISNSDGFQQDSIALIAQSVGAVIASAWVHDYAPNIRAQVLASPAFSVKLYVPLAEQGLQALYNIRGNFYVTSYVKSALLTHDHERAKTYDTDPLITRPISVRVLLGLNSTSDRIVQDAAAITVPTQLLISGSDWVVRAEPQHEFFNNLGSLTKERHVLPGFYHDTLGERDRELALSKARQFIQDAFSKPLEVPNLLNADKVGFTRREADELSTPLSPLSKEGAYWSLTRGSLQLGRFLSKGLALGHETGFDSGKTLDYVYQNKAEGLGPIGKLIDHTYINAIGWRGIRERKKNVENLIQTAITHLNLAAKPIRIVDIAAGGGRYTLEAVVNSDIKPESILLRDYSDLNVKAGTELIQELGLDGLANYVKADAFDFDSLASIQPTPTLGIVSGLYELFAENDTVLRSLNGLASAIPDGGYLIYTGQPWHPQLELIARALTSHRQGQAWVMRRRTQQELDQLVAHAGFTKVEQRIGPFGIFTVSLAIRNANPTKSPKSPS